MVEKADLPEKKAILQGDGETFAIVLHCPAGLLTLDNLKSITSIVEKYNIPAVKITTAQRIALAGVKEEDIDKIWQEVNMKPGSAVGACIRSVRACPGTTLCKKGKQDALGFGLKLDEKYHGTPLPAKMKIAVSGCPASCSESLIRDLGFTANEKGYKCYVGGSAGGVPHIGKLVAENLTEEQAFEITEKIIVYVKEKNSNKRLGRLIDEIGIEQFKTEAGI